MVNNKRQNLFQRWRQFHDVIRVVNKYGMIPEEAYRDIQNKKSSHDHTRFQIKNCGTHG